jgi:tetratricopeptide (TPR) repeat protein
MTANFLSIVFLLPSISCFSPSRPFADDALDAPRKEYALHFFSVDAHVNLAKQQYDLGNRLQAFYTLETARREHFGQKEFTTSFRRLFLNDTFDSSPQSESALQAQLMASRDDEKAVKMLADVYVSRKEWAKAIPLLETAIKSHPEEFTQIAALARVYTEMGQQAKAESTIDSWIQGHPQTVDAYHVRIDELFEKKVDARALVDEALRKYPNDPTLHFDLGIVFERADDLAGTQREFDTAVRLGPSNVHIVGWVARFYFMRKIDLRHALELYLNAYFLDPEFYETEYAEDRIRKLAPEVALAIMKKAASNELSPPDLLPFQPAVEKVLLRAAEHNWNADFATGALKILGSQDEVNRATAMNLLITHRDPQTEKQILQLLNEPAICKRGMAGYVAVKWNPQYAIPIVKTWLNDPEELVRFDAISALLESGGSEGRKLVQDYSSSGKEQNAYLRDILSHALSTNNGQR